jgi:protocatechuate 3,4-dioxygenase beta subunit
MIRPAHDEGPWHKYEVRIGHAHVTVSAHTRAEALVEGRRLLADDMPRMWDKIYSLADERFEVEEKQ